MGNKAVNLFWFGNNNKLSSGKEKNITDKEAAKLNGTSVTGKDELKAVEVSGDARFYNGENDSIFMPDYKSEHFSGIPSEMKYKSPTTGRTTTAKIKSFISADFKLTIINAAGEQEIVKQSGIIIHMNNGDMFFRPSVQSLKDWSGIKKLVGMEITSAKANGSAIATIGFNADIFDLPVVCFATGTMIRTDKGDVAVEFLRAGDLVLTKDAGFQPVKWVGGRQLDTAFLQRNPNMQPVRIRAGALGDNLPETDLVVSPQHRILVRSGVAQRYFGTAEVLVAAKHLTAIKGIEIAADIDAVGYHHFMFDKHQIVLSNGVETESLYAGKEALKALSPQARAEINAIFPELATRSDMMDAGARTFLSGKQGREIAALHSQDNLSLVG